MFTLKLFKSVNGQLVTRAMAVHHVQTMTCGDTGRLLELWAFRGQEPAAYDTYYIGDAEPGMNAVDDIAVHGNHYGWGLLENWEGNTSEHYRPAGYGHLAPVRREASWDPDCLHNEIASAREATDEELTAMPYPAAADLRRLAHEVGSKDVTARLNRLGIAVDA